MGLRGGTPGSKWQAERAREELTDRYESESIRRALEQPNPKEWRERQRRQDMSELTIEQVKVLLEDAGNGTWQILADGSIWSATGPFANIAMDPDGDCAPLIAAAPNLAALCLSLHAQLQQEREAREKLEALAIKWSDDALVAGETDGEDVYAGVLTDCAALLRAALARPAQADAGEGKAL